MDKICDEEPGASSNTELGQMSGQKTPLSTEESIFRGEQGPYID
jgi:hypothetical protein